VERTASSIDILPLEMATFTFAEDEPNAGEEGVVVAFVICHPSGEFLFDTGIGFGSREMEDRYHPRSRRLTEGLAEANIELNRLAAVVNCHLHVDHAGQNLAVKGIPIHVQRAEWEIAHTTDHTILEWIDYEGADYRLHDGDYELAPGIRVIATPGHTPGHQSIVVDGSEGSIILAGQALYSRDEWTGDPTTREGRSRAPDTAAYDRSVERLRSLDPVRVYFAHDRAVWSAQVESAVPC
jgi:glyoxylase-like metal-dependent hydrolase (beta-lactamase superfamily II)